MKKIIYILSFLCLVYCGTGKLSAQAIFNDTILFQIHKIRALPNNGTKYLLAFQSAPGSSMNLSGTIVMSLCGCYCDSIWDAWPPPSDNIIPGGTATLSYSSSGSGGSGGGILGNGGPNRFNGRLNIWQMPGSFSLTSAFTLPVVGKLD